MIRVRFVEALSQSGNRRIKKVDARRGEAPGIYDRQTNSRRRLGTHVYSRLPGLSTGLTITVVVELVKAPAILAL